MTALLSAASAIGLLALAVFLRAHDLDGAAAWSNIIALFVAIIGAGLSGASLWRSPPRTSRSSAIDSPGSESSQTSLAGRDAINVRGDNNSIGTGRD